MRVTLRRYPVGTTVTYASNVIAFPSLATPAPLTRPTDTLSAHNIQFVATLTNQRSTASQVGQW